MRLYISSAFESHIPNDIKIKLIENKHILCSFAYYKPYMEPFFERTKTLLIDSGAFTYMSASVRKKNFRFDPISYTKQYATFIKNHNFDNFIELDIESVVGFKTYKECYDILTNETGKQPIMVHHWWRGLEYYKELVKKCKWVALGDVNVIHPLMESYEKYYPWMIDYAHQYNCRVHGLAFTRTKRLGWMPFDSIDSSSWTALSRFGQVKTFNGHNLWDIECKRSEKGHLITDTKKLHEYSFTEWAKLSEYLDREYHPIW